MDHPRGPGRGRREALGDHFGGLDPKRVRQMAPKFIPSGFAQTSRYGTGEPERAGGRPLATILGAKIALEVKGRFWLFATRPPEQFSCDYTTVASG